MSKQPSGFLGVTVNQDNSEKSVTEVELEHGLTTGITLKKLGVDLVPLYEEHSTRVAYKYTMAEWDELPSFEKAIMVATRRIERSCDNIQAEASIKESKRMKR